MFVRYLNGGIHLSKQYIHTAYGYGNPHPLKQPETIQIRYLTNPLVNMLTSLSFQGLRPHFTGRSPAQLDPKNGRRRQADLYATKYDPGHNVGAVDEIVPCLLYDLLGIAGL